MDTGKFLHMCIEKKVSIVPYRDKSLNQYKKITEHFTYLCAFDENGVCSAKSNSKCCCFDCANHLGYLKKIRDSTNSIDVYASKFDKVYGFWELNTGCTLPRELRSTICTAFVCSTVRKKFEYINSSKIMMFMKLLYNYNSLSPKDKEDLDKLYINIRNTL